MDHEISRAASPTALASNGRYAAIVTHASSEPSRADDRDQRWMRDLAVLQVTSLFAAGLFMVVWLLH